MCSVAPRYLGGLQSCFVWLLWARTHRCKCTLYVACACRWHWVLTPSFSFKSPSHPLRGWISSFFPPFFSQTAFEDYVQKAIAGEAGCPINYYLKVLTKAQIAAVWCDLYVRKPQLDLANDGEGPEEEGGGEDGDDGAEDDGE